MGDWCQDGNTGNCRGDGGIGGNLRGEGGESGN